MSARQYFCFAAGLFLVLAASVRAEMRIYFGEDIGIANERLVEHPNADAARVTFLSALDSYSTDNLETFPPGTNDVSLNFGANVQARLAGTGSVMRVPSGAPYGTYPISENQFWLNASGFDSPVGPFTITFAPPQTAFGFYAVDVGDLGGQVRLSFDGTTTITIPATVNGANGSVLFFGVVRADTPFNVVTVDPTLTYDGAGFDDLVVGNATPAVPVQTLTWGLLKELWRN